jgi:hypothetical protein
MNFLTEAGERMRGLAKFFSMSVLMALGALVTSAALAQTPVTALSLVSGDQSIENPDSLPAASILTPDDEKFLDDLERKGMQFYIDEADPVSGLMPDRASANGGASAVGSPCSTASVGFGLTALCVGDSRGWISHQEAYDRSLRVLTFLHDHVAQVHGFFYHFLDMRTGERAWNCEVSDIDTALLMAGVLTVRQHFPGTALATLADQLYQRVDWPWLTSPDGTLYMGWKPEDGFIQSRWSNFSEGPPLIYLLGIGSRSHPLPATIWKAWRREPVTTYDGLTFMQCPPLFTHQYPQSWLDLRGLRDDYADYFRDSQLATLAQRQWFADELSKNFPAYSSNVWGLTASDSASGYTAWGGPPLQGNIDGSVVPCAAGGSLAFEPRICLDALETMRARWGEKAYEKYGFVDAFNPVTGWYNPDVLGIDLGPMVLMAENCRSGFVWKTFMSSPEIVAALKAAGFRRMASDDALPLTTSIYAATDLSAGK